MNSLYARALSVTIFWCCSIAFSYGQNLDEATKRIIEQHIELLGSADFQTREAAQQKLLQYDLKALASMRHALRTTTDLERSLRLSQLIERLETKRRREATKINLKLDDVTTKEALLAVAEAVQCDVRFEASPQGKRLNFHWVDQPLLKVLQELSEISSVTITPSAEQPNRLLVQPQDYLMPINSYQGPFRFAPISVNTSSRFTFGGLPRSAQRAFGEGATSVELLVFSEPKIPILAIGEVKLSEAKDDRGQPISLKGMYDDFSSSLASEADNDEELIPYFRSHSPSIVLHFGKVDRGAKEIKLLRGNLSMLTLKEARTVLDIESLKESVGKVFDTKQFSLQIRSVDGTINPARVSLSVRVKDLASVQEGKIFNFMQRLKIYDANGSLLALEDNEEYESTDQSLLLTFTVAPARGQNRGRIPRPTRLVLEEWIYEKQTVDFELNHVPLP